MTTRTARIVLAGLAVVLSLTVVASPADAGRKSGETPKEYLQP